MTFNEIAKTYVDYIKRNYGFAPVVFYGYASSTKTSEHLRREQGKITQNVIIKGENLVPYAKVCFLSSSNNKTELINFLSDHLTDNGQNVYVCKADADTKIVSTALDIAQNVPVIVVADDTDIAIMLLYHWKQEMCEVRFLQERGKSVGTSKHCIN